mgnify:FL=1
MAQYQVRSPDGTLHVISGPEGATPEQVVAAAQQMFSASAPAPAPQPSGVEQAGTAIREIPRQVGLAGRYGLEGVAQGLEMFTEPIRRIVVNPLLRMAGQPGVMSLREGASNAATDMGLPEPQTAGERVVGDAARSVAGVATGAGLYGKGAEMLGQAAP